MAIVWSTSKTSSMLSIFILYFSCRSMVISAASFEALPLPAAGPESFDFTLAGQGPFTGIADGRIVKYEESTIGFVDYGYTAPNRNKTFCDGTNNTYLAPICGRPLGLAFFLPAKLLYIADAGFGLVVVGPNGGAATQLATSANGVAFGFPDGVEVDQLTGVVYMTDASATYNLSQIDQLTGTRDATGRLIKYDPKTKQVTVLLSGLAGASGVAISVDGSFLLVTEFVKTRIQKYWLKGPKANTAEVLLNLTGSPDKIRRTIRGDFWVAVTVQTPTFALIGQRINGVGTILETITFSPEFNTTLITEVKEYKDKLYLGSLYPKFVGVYKR
uniref:Strictosidine synthase 2 n=1 Tax=Camptotheca acuminata TaxID=16922 RepID=A0A8F2YJ04_CAMAC|nr:strictosidine synthase 2 [Camptotheca acuminata]